MKNRNKTKILDCTLRDGGYYNAWDFSRDLVCDYLDAMGASKIDIVEIGFRFIGNNGFKGAHAFSKDEYLETLPIPTSVAIAVMLNASDLLNDGELCEERMRQLVPRHADDTPVELVRIACHRSEWEEMLKASTWLSGQGYRVGFNIMQIARATEDEIENISRSASRYPIEVLYFADSTGSLSPAECANLVQKCQLHWDGDIGFHTHDNMGLALQNCMAAASSGANWLDGTISGMGRGPGNARTEELLIEVSERNGDDLNLGPVMGILTKHFNSLKEKHGWGTNPYYFLSGKNGIHPTYVQEMLNDERYGDTDILAAIDHLGEMDAKEFKFDLMNDAKSLYRADPVGEWHPKLQLEGKEVLIVGTGPSVGRHKSELESFIKRRNPLVIALNTETTLEPEFIDLRAACHPVRLLADALTHISLPQPLITPASMLPTALRNELVSKAVLNFGIDIVEGTFEFHDSHCVVPIPLVIAYTLALTQCGLAKKVWLTGLDGYERGDPRNDEMNALLKQFMRAAPKAEIESITPTVYELPTVSVYAL